MKIFEKCRHEWEVIVNKHEKSQFEKFLEEVKSAAKYSFPKEAYLGKTIIILQCKKCGELNKTVEQI